MAGISEKRLNDMVLFIEAVQENGWAGLEIELTRPEMADIVGLSEYELAKVIRTFKEYPGEGVTISTRRGQSPLTVVTLDGERPADEIVKTIHLIAEKKAVENLARTVRDASASFLAYKKSDKSRANARAMKPYVNRLKSFLMSMQAQAAEDGDPFKLREMAERALVQVGVRYTDDEE